MRVALYCRISTDEDLQRYSLGNQEQALREHARRKGWDIAGVWQDQISGSKASRPGLNRLLDALEEHEFDAVLVTEQDRLSRLDEINWALMKQTFRDTGTTLHTLSGEVDFGNEDNEFTADLLALIDRRRRKTVVRQLIRGRYGAAQRGEWLGRPPYGYRRNPATKHLEPHPVEASLVREIFRDFASGRIGSARIAKEMQGRIVNRYVDAEFIVWLLRNPAYVGDVVVRTDSGETVRCDSAHVAIVSRDLWEAANRLLEARSGEYKKARLESRVGLVAGMVRCAACGGLLSPTTARKRVGDREVVYHYYRHVRKHREGLLPDGNLCRAAYRADKVDDEVRRQLVDLATSSSARRRVLREIGDSRSMRELEALERDLAYQVRDMARRRDRLLDLYTQSDWDVSELNVRKRRLDRDIASIERELRNTRTKMRLARSDAVALDLLAEAFAAAVDLESMSFAEQQTVVRGLVEAVAIDQNGRPTITAKLTVAALEPGQGKFAHHRVRAG